MRATHGLFGQRGFLRQSRAQVLKIVAVDESGIGFNPDRGPDRYFIVRLQDGATARFWHDGKGVVLNDDGTPALGDPKLN